MTNVLKVDDPFTGEIVYEKPMLEPAALDAVMEKAHRAHLQWRRTPLSERIALVSRFIDAFDGKREVYAEQISRSMGKPKKHALGEISAMFDRARQMSSIAKEGLAREVLPPKEGFERYITREPVGVVVVLAAWNYPLLIAINPISAALLAGNAVVLKHSSRTPCCGDQFQEAFEAAGAPEGLLTSINTDHALAESLVGHPRTGFVSFTGSVGGGRRIYQAVARSRFVDVALELGGKDPAYVAADADFEHTVENVMDGAFFNAGQSCCGIERVYVEAPVYERFLEASKAWVEKLALGNPMDEGTSMGPMAQPNAPGFLHEQVQQAQSAGARVLSGGAPCQHDGQGRFFAPTIVADTDHRMAIAKEESFGPVVSIRKVSGDEEAIAMMNDSDLGLTASVWSADRERALKVAEAMEAGTVFMNRADYLDPLLAWTGWKDSGKGVSLSKYGFHSVTRPKSYHLRVKL